MQRPNILFLFPDQHRPDFLSIFGKLPLRMENIESLTRRGVVFTRAITPSPLCAPARACLAAGKAYHRCRVENNGQDYPLDQPTFYAALRDAGYHTAGTGKFDLHKATLDWGLDGKRLISEWGFCDGIDNEGKCDAVISGAQQPKGPYMAYLHKRGLAAIHSRDMKRGYVGTHPTPLPDEAYCDNWLSDNALKLLAEFPTDKPWFLQVNFTGPHNPMDVTESMLDGWRDVVFPPPANSSQYDRETHNRIRRNYAAMLENIDRNIGRLLREVERRGELENTLIVYSSDHGEMLGDHDQWGKSTWRNASLGIPMIVAGPGVQGGRTIDSLVQLYDLAATFLDYGDTGQLADSDSNSLRPMLEAATSRHRETLIAGLHGRTKWDAIADERYKLVLENDQPPMLFDTLNDPEELNNIAEAEPEQLKRLSDILKDAVKV